MDYVIEENIRRFEVMLAGDLEPEKRLIVKGLLAEQKAKLTGSPRTSRRGELSGGGECPIQLS